MRRNVTIEKSTGTQKIMYWGDLVSLDLIRNQKNRYNQSDIWMAKISKNIEGNVGVVKRCIVPWPY